MKFTQRKIYVLFLFIFSMSTMVHAGTPVWTFTTNPSYPPTVSVPANSTATVQYTVTNQSTKPHTLVMTAIPGITPTVTGCASGCSSSATTLCLPTRGSTCTLTLSVDGRQLQGNVSGGPKLCEQGSALQCYRPANPLNITLTAAQAAVITVTPSTLALSVTGLTTTTGNNSGTPRVFTIHNAGPGTAFAVTGPASASPSISSISYTGCESIPINSDCTVTITPSATPSAAVADTNPTPITLTIQGSNTNPLNPTVNVLTYGSFYQAGYLFSIIETVNTSLSIGGTVAAESDNATQNSTQYSLSGADTTPAMYSGTNGTANTAAMVAQYDAGNYSATVCTTFSGGGYADWYLPAICQMGFGGSDANFDCGASPGLIPNMQYNLLITNPSQSFNFFNTGLYWSSTASENGAPDNAWYQQFALGGGDGFQNSFNVANTLGVRCVRDFQ